MAIDILDTMNSLSNACGLTKPKNQNAPIDKIEVGALDFTPSVQ